MNEHEESVNSIDKAIDSWDCLDSLEDFIIDSVNVFCHLNTDEDNHYLDEINRVYGG